MTTTNSLNIKNDGIPIFNTATGSFASTIPPEDQALVGGANGTILGVDPTGFDVGNPLCNTGVGTPPNYSASPTVDDITIINLPINETDGANKKYVDMIASGFNFLDATLCATTANLNANYSNGASGVGATLTNVGTFQAFSIDNYTPATTERVLIKNQTNSYENGVYIVSTPGDSLTAWVLTRASEYDQSTEILPGTLVSVLYGDTNGDTIWAQTQNVTNVGTDPILFILFNENASGYLLAANNLSDVQNVATSRSNLGLTNVATQNVTQYSVLVGDANDNIVSLPTGAYGQVLTSGGPNVNPSWAPVGGSGISSVNVQVFNTAGTYTYTPSANMQSCIVELLGAGGGGGVTLANGGTDSWQATGGAGGGYTKSFYNAATIGTSQSIVVGAGGAGSQLRQNAGNGGNSTFGSLMTAGGGAGGLVNNGYYNFFPAFNAGGSATGGNICNVVGEYPIAILSDPSQVPTAYPARIFSGSSLYGRSGLSLYSLTQSQPGQSGFPGQGNGSGGGIGASFSGASATGGNGADGLCIITEYIGG